MLTSNRRFGIEIEFVAPSRTALERIHREIRVVDDGSLRPIPNAGEYVSDVLRGDKGEQTVRYACEVLKKNGAQASDPATSVHVHLDGVKRARTLRSSRTPPTEQEAVFAISNRLKKDMREEQFTQASSMGSLQALVPYGEHAITRFDNSIRYFAKTKLTREPKFNYTYYWLEQQDRFKWLRNVFYFYTVYSQVMEDIVSNSRKCGNMYCIPLGKSYLPDEIESCENMDQLVNVWYKSAGPTGHYDDSRYHNVNLHSYFDRHGTVEIRSHGGTIDPGKILLWLRLHQNIADKLEDMELEDIKFDGNIHKAFIEFIEEPVLQSYVKRLLGYYSNIKIQ